ncbi:alpha/beta fold hydrolase [Halobacterium sp. KA-6]|jgi:pimeloyl-ACP methyl ester carboxylesterase|uniref:alpha/beta fold hydrolase n=1 Tax=Halobacterium sp. KA-6 TaxID=2896368 RepID=UPI001E3CD04F|nr:alpha/beta hydrolase [Halobacterium sp. KA-6]MCD2203389.1 alpha/beta hydrolase [Halobacterium sp. KA-6]
MSDLTGKYIDIDGTRTYYETTGDPDKQSIILIHTAGADGRQWRYVAPELADLGYHVVIPDLPGHGKSYPADGEPNTTIIQHADAVWQLIEVLDIDQPVVSGCSVGGDAALSLAIDHADDLAGAVVMEGAGRTRGAQLGRLSHPHALPGWQDILEYSVIDAVGPTCPEAHREELAWQHRSAHEIATNDLQAWADFNRVGELDKANCPVMLVRGADDYFIQDDVFKETVEQLPDVEPVVLSEIGHYPMMEDPDQITTLIDDFSR